MMSDVSPTWYELEDQVYKGSLEKHPEEGDLMLRLEGHLRDAFASLDGGEPDTTVQRFNYLVLLGAANYVHVAFDLALKGYYAQSLCLTRVAFEYGLAGYYALANPKRAEELEERGAEWPPPRELREVASEYLAEGGSASGLLMDVLRKQYSFLSQFTHPRYTSIASVFESERKVKLGPLYRRNGFLHAFNSATMTMLLLSDLARDSFSQVGTDSWLNAQENLVEAIGSWGHRVLSEIGSPEV